MLKPGVSSAKALRWRSMLALPAAKAISERPAFQVEFRFGT